MRFGVHLPPIGWPGRPSAGALVPEVAEVAEVAERAGFATLAVLVWPIVDEVFQVERFAERVAPHFHSA